MQILFLIGILRGEGTRLLASTFALNLLLCSFFSLEAQKEYIIEDAELFDISEDMADDMSDERGCSHQSSPFVSQNIPGSWRAVVNQPNPAVTFGLNQQLLLTDGTVLAFDIANNANASGRVFKLTPDINGNYVNGTWSELAPLPIINGVQYAPASFASAVLADGRLVVFGGETNGPNGDFSDEALGAIYDPVANVWTPINPPQFFQNLFGPPPPIGVPAGGDAASVVLSDGTFMVFDPLSFQTALLDSKNLTWTETGLTSNGNQTKANPNNEEGWTLLPNGKVLTVNTYNYNYVNGQFIPPSFTGSEIYDPIKGTWSSDSGSTIVQLNNQTSKEIGASVLRPDGKVVQFGAQARTPQNPGTDTAAHIALYDWKKNTWSAGPDLPFVPGTGFL